MTRLLTASDVAELLAVPERWVREHTRGGLIPIFAWGGTSATARTPFPAGSMSTNETAAPGGAISRVPLEVTARVRGGKLP